MEQVPGFSMPAQFVAAWVHAVGTDDADWRAKFARAASARSDASSADACSPCRPGPTAPWRCAPPGCGCAGRRRPARRRIRPPAPARSARCARVARRQVEQRQQVGRAPLQPRGAAQPRRATPARTSRARRPVRRAAWRARPGVHEEVRRMRLRQLGRQQLLRFVEQAGVGQHAGAGVDDGVAQRRRMRLRGHFGHARARQRSQLRVGRAEPGQPHPRAQGAEPVADVEGVVVFQSLPARCDHRAISCWRAALAGAVRKRTRSSA